MTTTQTDPRPTFTAAMATAGEVVAAVRPDQLDLPTPCEAMDVRALLTHLIVVLDRIATIGRGGNPFEVEVPTIADDEVDVAWKERAETLLAVWADDAALAVPSPLPWAPGTGADLLLTYTFELTTHTWDLATATGQQPAWSDDALAVAADWAEGMGTTPEARAERFEPIYAQLPPSFREMPAPFADPLPVADDAPLIDKIVAWSGRRS